MSEWQPIKEAPKDGSIILARVQVDGAWQAVFIRWDKGRDTWVHDDGGSVFAAYAPQEWVPVPEAFLVDLAAFKAKWDLR